MIGENEPRLVGAGDFLAPDGGERAIGADHEPSAHARILRAVLGSEVNGRDPIGVASDLLILAASPSRAGLRRPPPQPFVEFFPIHHADEAAAVDRHVDAQSLWRDHPGGIDARLEEMIGDFKITDQARRNRAAARLDASARDRAAEPCARGARDRRRPSLRKDRRRQLRRRRFPPLSLEPPISRARGHGVSRPRRRANGWGLADSSNIVRQRGSDEKQEGFPDEDDRVGGPGDGTKCRTRSTPTVPRNPPRPKAVACAAPHKPIRVPSREPEPAPARPIIDPIAATAKAPFETPSANTAALRG